MRSQKISPPISSLLRPIALSSVKVKFYQPITIQISVCTHSVAIADETNMAAKL